MKAKELHAHLASQGIRLFALSLGTMADTMAFIHPHKTTEEWRQDVRRFIDEIGHTKSKTGDAGDNAFNVMMEKLSDAGYIEVNDMVSDVYEGCIVSYSSGIKDSPAHEDQPDGFGHYGWESKPAKTE
jgi:hypothetical protein